MAILLLAVSWTAAAEESDSGGSFLDKLLSPGPLMEGHKDLDGIGCLKCHGANRGVPDAKCLACHKDGDKIEGMEAFHDMCMGCHKTIKKGPALCGECHINQ